MRCVKTRTLLDDGRDRGGHTVVTIRVERAGDAGPIHAVHASSFPAAAEARLVDRLREAGRLSVSLVAEEGGRVIGHVGFSPVTVASGEAGAGLAPVAVLEGSRKQGIAARLIEAGLDGCRAAGIRWAVVLGEPGYYGRFGFREAREFGLFDEYGGGPVFQAMELEPGGLPRGAGLVRYAPEFADLGVE
jgi:putative acetyltransferase